MSDVGNKVKVVVIGSPGAGKSSYLSSILRGGAGGNESRWRAEADPQTRQYLRAIWTDLYQGSAVASTQVGVVPPILDLLLTRQFETVSGSGRSATLKISAIDTPGEVFANPSSRERLGWADRMKPMIAEADVVIVVIDAMKVAETESASGEEEVDLLMDLLGEAHGNPGGRARKPTKLLALCFAKCDGQRYVSIDGRDDGADAVQLANRFLSPAHQSNLRREFAKIRFFAVSILRDGWRWTRDGACVRVGDRAVLPIGVYEPFDWLIGQ